MKTLILRCLHQGTGCNQMYRQIKLVLSCLIACCLILTEDAGLLKADEPDPTKKEFAQVVQPFFKKHCTECHGAKTQEAERNFSTLSFPIANDDQLIDFQDALDVLNLGEMPPDDRPQPGTDEKATVIDWLTRAIKFTHQQRTASNGETVLRRLSAREYRHTIGDLFELDMRGFDPTESFPADQKIHHLDNQGDHLVTSGFLLQQYLNAADRIVEKAVPSLKPPKRQTWFFDHGFRQQPELDFRRIRIETNQAKQKGREVDRNRLPGTIRIYENPRAPRHMGAYGFVWDFKQGVPHDGYYEITLDLEAMNSTTPYEKNHSQIRESEPIQFGIIPGNIDFSDLHVPQPIEPELFRTELSGNRETVVAKVWLHKGTSPRFIWPNGSSRMRAAHIEVGKMLFQKAGNHKPATEEAFVHGIANAKLPHIRIYSVKIDGPIYDQWPSRTQQQILGGPTFDPVKNRDNLKRFMTRAFRRPVAESEVDRFQAVITAREQQGVQPFNAFLDSLKAVICSPGFIYLDEPVDQNGKLSPHAVASRLSYFLWSSMPDSELIRLANNGELLKKSTLARQVNRMLDDPRSDRFIKGFLESWLTLDNLGQTPPDSNRFSVYYRNDLESAMEAETNLFTRHIVDNDLSIDNFIESDFTFVNANLAELYYLGDKYKGKNFQKVDVSQVSHRGGLLGQASVLTVSANGVDTSPVVRGVWVLENLLGTPPSPPPPDVEPLDPDIRGAKSIRDQLEKHRNDPTCATCHRKIDPLGFALENYDPIGQWRTSYRGGKGQKRVKIDASGKMMDGETFRNIEQFKQLLLKRKDRFAKALTEKLIAYAVGRSVEISDRPEIDQILSELDEQERSFRFLIERVVTSSIFIQP